MEAFFIAAFLYAASALILAAIFEAIGGRPLRVEFCFLCSFEFVSDFVLSACFVHCRAV
jgi:hypothetical protein